ncbi:helix-turn-helix transcriptional regulator [Sphingomonas sp.]|uniref:helix-turn-helix transcriptional regulator n=1 Tax=Sphingomonas sp. TaxID=28214 RepID=UPI002BF0B511|nr:helix-turn-helix transcriptional regulator [Sphingomonas sp.]HTG38851.1 helix-turn-helix transcriptional regulator [Sphingomonas sp.]
MAQGALGDFLKNRRGRIDAAALGFSGRRRTPGLRREEVAQRANISATWYTWLEQGRGGAPSARVLDSLATALMLTDVEREHLFLVAIGQRPMERRAERDAVSPRLQRLLDAFGDLPATIKTATWDVVAWNRAATVCLADYASLAPSDRNVVRRLFLDPQVRAMQADWQDVARYVVASLRADSVRAGAADEVAALVAEMSAASADFAAMWQDRDVRDMRGGIKRLIHPVAGPIGFEYSTFPVDGRPDLQMMLFNPATDADRARIAALLR